ncbi:unnamed protein product [Closterium sp. NIES-53]
MAEVEEAIIYFSAYSGTTKESKRITFQEEPKGGADLLPEEMNKLRIHLMNQTSHPPEQRNYERNVNGSCGWPRPRLGRADFVVRCAGGAADLQALTWGRRLGEADLAWSVESCAGRPGVGRPGVWSTWSWSTKSVVDLVWSTKWWSSTWVVDGHKGKELVDVVARSTRLPGRRGSAKERDFRPGGCGEVDLGDEAQHANHLRAPAKQVRCCPAGATLCSRSAAALTRRQLAVLAGRDFALLEHGRPSRAGTRSTALRL